MPTPLHTSPSTTSLPGIPPAPPAAPDLGDAAYLRLPDVLALFPVSPSTWYALIRQGTAPAPHKLGSGSFWRAADVRAFLNTPPQEITAALAAARELRRAKA